MCVEHEHLMWLFTINLSSCNQDIAKTNCLLIRKRAKAVFTAFELRHLGVNTITPFPCNSWCDLGRVNNLPYSCTSLANDISNLATTTIVLPPYRWVNCPWCHRQTLPTSPNIESVCISSSTQYPWQSTSHRVSSIARSIGLCRMQSTMLMMYCCRTQYLSVHLSFWVNSYSNTANIISTEKFIIILSIDWINRKLKTKNTNNMRNWKENGGESCKHYSPLFHAKSRAPKLN